MSAVPAHCAGSVADTMRSGEAIVRVDAAFEGGALCSTMGAMSIFVREGAARQDEAVPSLATQSDIALIERAQHGDVDAFAVLYDRHAPIVLALAARMLSSGSEAHDLVHDVFLEAWEAVRSYDSARASVRTWLLVRARSRALDHHAHRKRTAQVHEQIERVARHAAQQQSRPPEQRVAVVNALSQLTTQVRETLELRYYEGLTAPEIAQRMAVPEGTVRSRIATGLQTLSAAMRVQEDATRE